MVTKYHFARLEKKETKLCLVTKLCTMVLSIFVYLQTLTKSFVAQHYVVAWFCSVNRVEQKPQREGSRGIEKGLHPWVDIPCGPKEPFQWVDQKKIKMCKLEDFFLQVNNCEIIVNFFLISHNLTWYSAIVHRFTRIYPVCSTCELTKQFM